MLFYSNFWVNAAFGGKGKKMLVVVDSAHLKYLKWLLSQLETNLIILQLQQVLSRLAGHEHV